MMSGRVEVAGATVGLMPARAKPSAPSRGEGWLLLSVSSSGPSSSLRVYTWRKLKGLGGHYVQQSVCLLPDRPETQRTVQSLLAKVRDEGGEARLLHVAITDPADEEALIEQFQAERSDEYNEVCGRTPAFLDELAQERSRGRVTYNELEESEADLARLRTWLARIQSRDYFQAPGRAEAEAAVAACALALSEFEADALAAEAAPRQPTRRLRSVSSD